MNTSCMRKDFSRYIRSMLSGSCNEGSACLLIMLFQLISLNPVYSIIKTSENTSSGSLGARALSLRDDSDMSGLQIVGSSLGFIAK